MHGLSQRLGPLVERRFRLLFAATTITTAGDAVAYIALAFAVLDLPGGSATDLGIILAARQAVSAAVLVGGGVISDRFPRHRVLVGASLIQGAAQAVTAALVLSGEATVASLVVLQAAYGLGHGLVIPAEVGLVPQTVSAERLQQANALQGLSRNLVFVLGPAVGGALVVAGSPGIALAADAASFCICAALVSAIRLPPRTDGDRLGFVTELREGWKEFTAHTWLWATVGLFGISNMAGQAWNVLGPVIAKEELGGAGAWATILTCGGVGAVAGGLLALRLRPRRLLLASVLAAVPIVLQYVVLALSAPTAVIAAANLVVGAGLALHLAYWFTVFQQQVPPQAQSRVSSYDALGSFVLIPVGTALVGPVAVAIGRTETLWAAAAVNVLCFVGILSVRAVWTLQARGQEVADTA